MMRDEGRRAESGEGGQDERTWEQRWTTDMKEGHAQSVGKRPWSDMSASEELPGPATVPSVVLKVWRVFVGRTKLARDTMVSFVNMMVSVNTNISPFVPLSRPDCRPMRCLSPPPPRPAAAATRRRSVFLFPRVRVSVSQLATRRCHTTRDYASCMTSSPVGYIRLSMLRLA